MHHVVGLLMDHHRPMRLTVGMAASAVVAPVGERGGGAAATRGASLTSAGTNPRKTRLQATWQWPRTTEKAILGAAERRRGRASTRKHAIGKIACLARARFADP